jgi:uncharacterized membrane protein
MKTRIGIIGLEGGVGGYFGVLLAKHIIILILSDYIYRSS